MRVKNITFSDLKHKKDFSLSVIFHITFGEIFKKYSDFINSTGEKLRLGSIIEIKQVKNSSEIKMGDILMYHTVFSDIKIWIAKKEDIEKYNEKNISSVRKIELKKTKQINNNYLAKYFSIPEVQKYLSLFLRGNFAFKYLSSKNIYGLYIPLNSSKISHGVSSTEISDITAHQDILLSLYKEYLEAKENNLEISQLVLMGSIVENILIQQLINIEIKSEYLNHFQGIGKLLELTKIEKVFLNNKAEEEKNKDIFGKYKKQEKDIISLFQSVNNARNLLHPKKHLEQITEKDNIKKEADNAFQKIIQDFLPDIDIIEK